VEVLLFSRKIKLCNISVIGHINLLIEFKKMGSMKNREICEEKYGTEDKTKKERNIIR
jgi:hypothetical protein